MHANARTESNTWHVHIRTLTLCLANLQGQHCHPKPPKKANKVGHVQPFFQGSKSTCRHLKNKEGGPEALWGSSNFQAGHMLLFVLLLVRVGG